jgi:hypothetical protein
VVRLFLFDAGQHFDFLIFQTALPPDQCDWASLCVHVLGKCRGHLELTPLLAGTRHRAPSIAGCTTLVSYDRRTISMRMYYSLHRHPSAAISTTCTMQNPDANGG